MEINKNDSWLQEKTFWSRLKLKTSSLLSSNNSSSNPIKGTPLKIGLVGAGNVVYWKYIPAFKALHSLVNLEGVFDINNKAAELVHQQTGARVFSQVEEMIEDPDIDAIFICTPPSAHFEDLKRALNADKHILCEKPFGLNFQEAIILYEMAEKSSKIHQINFINRFNSSWSLFRSVIQKDVIGTPYTCWGNFAQGGWFEESKQRIDQAAWRQQLGGGVIHELGSHLMDLMRWIFGEVDGVQGWIKKIGKTGIYPDDIAGIGLKFASGFTAQLEISRVATSYKERSFIEVYGSKGCLRLDQDNVYLWTQKDPQWKTLLNPLENPFEFIECFYKSIRKLSKNREPSADFYDGLKNNQIIDGIFLSSASNGAFISLPALKSQVVSI